MAVWNVCTVWPTHCVQCSGDTWADEPCADSPRCAAFRRRVQHWMRQVDAKELADALLYIAHYTIRNETQRRSRVPAAALAWAARVHTPSALPGGTAVAPSDAHAMRRRCASAVAAIELHNNREVRISDDRRKALVNTREFLCRAVRRAQFPGGLKSIEQFAAETRGLTNRLQRPTFNEVRKNWGATSSRMESDAARGVEAKGMAAVRPGGDTYILQHMHECLHAAVHLGAPQDLVDAAANGVMDAEQALVLGERYTPEARAQRKARLLQHHASHTAHHVLRKFDGTMH